MYSSKLFILLFIVLVVTGCNDRGNVVLSRVFLKDNAGIDTIEQYPGRGILILNKMEIYHLGNFTNNFIIQKNNRGNKIAYKIEAGRGEWVRFTKDYIAFMKPHTTVNQGWFEMKNGEITHELPKLGHILDSLKKQNSKEYFLKEVCGYIFFYLKGRVVKSYNYGNFITKYKTVNFDSLDYKLYKLDGDSLRSVSNNGNDIEQQKDGVFFVPAPGFNVGKLFSKKEIINEVDSISNLQVKPEKIRIKAVDLDRSEHSN